MLRFAAPTEPWEEKGGWFFPAFSVVATAVATHPWVKPADRKDESDEGSEVEAEVEDWDSFSPTFWLIAVKLTS